MHGLAPGLVIERFNSSTMTAPMPRFVAGRACMHPVAYGKLTTHVSLQNLIRTNSWESYVAANGTSIQMFDGKGCDGELTCLASWLTAFTH